MTASSITTSTNDERAVLGCAVRDDKCAALVLTRLSEDDFTDLDLGDAFRELREVWKKYGRADAVTVSRLPHAELLVSCADTVPSLSGCEIYIAHVKEKAVQMKAATIALEIATGKLSTQEIAERAGDIARLTIGGGRVKIRTMPEMLVDFLKTHRKGEKPEYIKTGLGLEDFVRVKPGNFFVIGARPSVGKTAYSLQMALNIARAGKKVLYFSLETNSEGISERIVACAGGYRLVDVMDNEISWDTQREAKAIDILSRYKVDVVDTVYSPAVMEALAVAHGYDAIVIDYLGLMDPGERTNSLYERVTKMSMALHRIAQKNNLLVIALCQLNRGGTEVPKMEHLRESGQIEQDADVIVLLHSDEEKEEYTAIVAKNKTGKCGAIPLWYDREKQHFSVIETRRSE
ncbi:hypothetical protein DWW15_12930 [Subdoligranulum sp. AF14-43]|jgi:replicative DNA helicase|nr:hypothetical protein DWW15_12930 [Subdoligranulum sp. AF14-43]